MSNWEEKRLGEVCNVISGYAFKSNDFKSKGQIPVIKISNIGNGYVDLDNNTQYVDVQSVSTLDEKYTVKFGDVLVSLTGSHITQPNSMVGRTAIYKSQSPSILNQRAGKIIGKKNKGLGKFIYYILRTQWIREYIGIIAHGAANQANISPKSIENIKTFVPPLPTQQKIADILSAYDDLIENNNRRIELLEKAAQNLYKEWFVRFRFPNYKQTKFENGLPKGWEVAKVKNIVKRLPFGTLYKENNVSAEGRVIVIDQSRKEYVGFHNNEPSHKASIDNPIIIFGDHSCKMQLMINDFSLSENVVPFISQNKIPILFLYYLVNSLIETTEYKRHWTEFMNKKVLMPNGNLQELFDKKVKNSKLLINNLQTQNRNLIKQRDLLLPRLMSGKIEV
ncbi:restriction endonuclease subunit S [Calidifontibacillus oryziterrae]|uniref:restriction endonuclease subunit S n=1 Tax=Calidifontibacillus oryziterrae TaxID=1191699 RepID=UPI0002E0113C|nr:restriction endonuclease subunit S [Calidifontibacillus oryziterrae]